MVENDKYQQPRAKVPVIDARRRVRATVLVVVVGVLVVVAVAARIAQSQGDDEREKVVRSYFEGSKAEDCDAMRDLQTEGSSMFEERRCEEAEGAIPGVAASAEIDGIELTHVDGKLAVVRVEGAGKSDNPVEVLLLKEEGDWLVERVHDTATGTVPRSLPEYVVTRFLAAIDESPHPDCAAAIQLLSDSAVDQAEMSRHKLHLDCTGADLAELQTSEALATELQSRDGGKAVVEVTDDSTSLGTMQIPVVLEGSEWRLEKVLWTPTVIDPAMLQECSMSADEFAQLNADDQQAYENRCGDPTPSTTTTTAPPPPTTAPPPPPVSIQQAADEVMALLLQSLGCTEYNHPSGRACSLSGGARYIVVGVNEASVQWPDQFCKVAGGWIIGEWKGRGLMILAKFTADKSTDVATSEQVATLIDSQTDGSARFCTGQ